MKIFVKKTPKFYYLPIAMDETSIDTYQKSGQIQKQKLVLFPNQMLH